MEFSNLCYSNYDVKISAKNHLPKTELEFGIPKKTSASYLKKKKKKIICTVLYHQDLKIKTTSKSGSIVMIKPKQK